jgi:transposase
LCGPGQQRPKLEVEAIERSDAVSGGRVLPKRWAMERRFGWRIQHRRLVRDWERSETSATGWIFVAVMRVMPHRLA